MTAALAISIAPEAAPSASHREHVHVLEPRPNVREVLLATPCDAARARVAHVVIVLGGGGGGFAVTSLDGVLRVQGGLPLPQRQRLADAIGGAVVALSPPSDQPVMNRAWRLSDNHIADIRAAVDWSQREWPHAQRWVLGLNNGALSAAVATASIDELAGAVLLSSVEEALAQPPKSERMRVLAVRYRGDGCPSHAMLARSQGRRTLVTVYDERQARATTAQSAAVDDDRQFGGKEYQVVDVVARWLVTGAAPDEIR